MPYFNKSAAVAGMDTVACDNKLMDAGGIA